MKIIHLQFKLSNSEGSFANPVNIGTSNTGGQVTVTVPTTIATGSGYRVRVISNSPSLISNDNGNNITIMSQGITLTNVSSNNLCIGEILTVTFISDPMNEGNVFTIQLSDSDGSFNNPTNLDTSSVEGQIEVTIPNSILPGTDYRIRVISSSPNAISNDNGTNITIGTPSINITNISRDTLFVGSSFAVTFTSDCMNDDNTFTIQLSNSEGSFANPVNIGNSNTDGQVTVTVPTTIATGTGYRVRIISNSPSLISNDNGNDITIMMQGITLTSVSSNNLCIGEILTVTFVSDPMNDGNVFTIQLSDSQGSFTNPTNLGTSNVDGQVELTVQTSIQNGTGYQIRVVSSNPNSISNMSQPITIKHISEPLLNSPLENELISSIYPLFLWTEVDCADSYLIQISESNDFINESIIHSYLCENTFYHLSENILQRGRTYYWRVASKDTISVDVNYWSETRSFKLGINEYIYRYLGNEELSFKLDTNSIWLNESNTNQIRVQNKDVTINNYLKFYGDVTIDTVAYTINANGRVYLASILYPGTNTTMEYTFYNNNFQEQYGEDGILFTSLINQYNNVSLIIGLPLRLNRIRFNNGINSSLLNIDGSFQISGLSNQCFENQSNIFVSNIEVNNDGFNFNNADIENIGIGTSVCANSLETSYSNSTDMLTINGLLEIYPWFENLNMLMNISNGVVDELSITSEIDSAIIVGTSFYLKDFSGLISNIESAPNINIELGGILKSNENSNLFEMNLNSELDLPSTIYFTDEEQNSASFIKNSSDNWQIETGVNGEFNLQSNINFQGNINTIPLDEGEYFLSGTADYSITWEDELTLIAELNASLRIPQEDSWEGNVIYELIDWYSGTLPFTLSATSLFMKNNKIAGNFDYDAFGWSKQFHIKIDLNEEFPESVIIGNGIININEYLEDDSIVLSEIQQDDPYSFPKLPLQRNTQDDLDERNIDIDGILNDFNIISLTDNMELVFIKISSGNILPNTALLDPDGNIHYETTTDSLIVYFTSDDNNQAFWVLTEPLPGNWQLVVESPQTNDSLDVFTQLFGRDFNINVSQRLDTVKVTWNNENVPINSSVDIFFDKDKIGFNGFKVASTNESTGEASIILSNQLPECEYYLYAIRNDNDIIYRTYSDSLISNNKSNLPAPDSIIGTYYNGINKLYLKWVEPQSNNIAGYKIKSYLYDKDSIIYNQFYGKNNLKISIDSNKSNRISIASYNRSGILGCYSNEIIVEFKEGQSISINQGWNFLSSYIISEDVNIDYVLKEILDNLVIVKNNSGAIYYPQININNIGDWNYLEGYQMYMTSPDTLFVLGSMVEPENTPITLIQGWHIIPYLRNSEMAIEYALESLENSFLIVKDNSGNIYLPAIGINSIGNMRPGQSYYIYMLYLDTLIYPEN